MTEKNLPQAVKFSVEMSLEKKAESLIVLNLSEISSFTDFFVIMHGNSSRQNLAICECIEEELKKNKIRPISVEGKENAEWILMDYGDFIIHIFSGKARDYYSLEKLWGDAPRLTFS